VLLAYVDESYSTQRYYMAAVVLTGGGAQRLTKSLDEIVSRAVQDIPEMSELTELHAHEIVTGKKGWAPLRPQLRTRIGVYRAALTAIVDSGAAIILRGIDFPRLKNRYQEPDNPHSLVLGHLIERVNDLAVERDELAVMFADEVDQHDTYRRNLWFFQRSGTWGYRARPIDRVVDTLYFAPSNVSRLLQAADLVAYLYRRHHEHVETDARAQREWDAMWDQIAPAVHHMNCWMP
jgi:hypothetical protein